MFLNDNIVDFGKPDERCLSTFVVDEFQDYFYISQSFLLNI